MFDVLSLAVPFAVSSVRICCVCESAIKFITDIFRYIQVMEYRDEQKCARDATDRAIKMAAITLDSCEVNSARCTGSASKCVLKINNNNNCSH